MDMNLRARASKNFEKYLNDFITRGESNGLPHDRLSAVEWDMLNKELNKQGVSLIPRRHHDGYLYYWFSKAENKDVNSLPTDKKQMFNEASMNVYNLLLGEIRNKYPNIPDSTIIEMIKTQGKDRDAIYELLRYKQNGKYDGTSYEEFEDAFVYALQTCGNKNELIAMPLKHHWNAQQYEYCSNLSIRDGTWPDGRSIQMYGTQDWTWFRKCMGDVLPAVKDPQSPWGYHISLNINVNRKVLSVLDKIVLEDGGQYIFAYKFPKTNYFSDVTTRHDPVTIYLNARNPELERKIVKAMQPFARSNDGLVGEMLGAGVCISPETSNNNQGMSVGNKVARDIADMISKYRDRL